MAFEDTLIGLGIGLLLTALVYLIMKMQLRQRIALLTKEFEKTWAEQESSSKRNS